MVSASPRTRAGRFCRPLCSRITPLEDWRARRPQTAGNACVPLKMKRLLLIAVGFLLAVPFSASAQKPQSAKKHVKQGLERFGRNDIVGAIAEYQRAIDVDPNYAEAYLNRGKARRAAGDLDGAAGTSHGISAETPLDEIFQSIAISIRHGAGVWPV